MNENCRAFKEMNGCENNDVGDSHKTMNLKCLYSGFCHYQLNYFVILPVIFNS